MDEQTIKHYGNMFDVEFSIFDKNDSKSATETTRVVAEIILSEDVDFIRFSAFYFYLFNLRIKSCRNEHEVLRNKEVWPRINSAKTCIYEYINNEDKESYKSVKEYILNDFNKLYDIENNKYSELLKNQLCKIKEEKKLAIEYERDKDIALTKKVRKFGADYNVVTLNLRLFEIRRYYYLKAIAIRNDYLREHKYFWIALILAIASIVIGIIGICWSK